MKIREIIEKVTSNYDFSRTDWVEFDKIQSFLGLSVHDYDDDEWNKRVHEHYFISWMCTDTLVGHSIIFFDKKPVLLASQEARKNPKTFEVIDENRAIEFTDFILNMQRASEREVLPMADLDEEVGEAFSLEFENAVTAKTITYDGETFEVVRFHLDWQNKSTEWLAFIDRPGEPRQYLPHIKRETRNNDGLKYGISSQLAITNDRGATVRYIPVQSAHIKFDLG
jgi:hypothetical protein